MVKMNYSLYIIALSTCILLLNVDLSQGCYRRSAPVTKTTLKTTKTTTKSSILSTIAIKDCDGSKLIHKSNESCEKRGRRDSYCLHDAICITKCIYIDEKYDAEHVECICKEGYSGLRCERDDTIFQKSIIQAAQPSLFIVLIVVIVAIVCVVVIICCQSNQRHHNSHNRLDTQTSMNMRRMARENEIRRSTNGNLNDTTTPLNNNTPDTDC